MYHSQLVVLAYPIVANNGVPSDNVDLFKLKKNFESDRIHATALIVSNHHTGYSHFNSVRSLEEWLTANNVPGLCGIDTRSLVKKLRSHGEMKGQIFIEGATNAVSEVVVNPVKEVSNREPRAFRPLHFNASTAKRIIVIDCGISNSMIRLLMTFNVCLLIVPWDFDLFSEQWDAIFISSGPDCDPDKLGVTVRNVQRALALSPPKPIMGMGLGCLLLARATGVRINRMKHGNRGLNFPCMDLRTGKCYITAQNHGYSIDSSTLAAGWQELFINMNDHSNEGIIHDSKPFFGVQFIPGSDTRPTDINYIMKQFLDTVVGHPQKVHTMPVTRVQLRRKVLVIGSPGLASGETGQHDLLGCQAIRALREAQIEVVLVNPNIASVQTSHGEADKVYFLPVRPEFLKDIIKKEVPDSIVFSVGGQTAVDCGRILAKEGTLEKFKLEVLGTSLSSMELVEDHDTFAAQLQTIGLQPTPFRTVTTLDSALQAAEFLGFPVVIRISQALETSRQYYALNLNDLRSVMDMALKNGGTVTLEKSLQGYKEVQYEVLRDRFDNCISVCDMENLYPLGMNSQDAIFVVPVQTLGSAELGLLQTAALKIVRQFDIVGSCCIQFALYPGTHDFYVTNVSTVMSPSAAFASCATGYPLSYIATKLALGYALTDLQNPMSSATTAYHEPCLDYCAIRIPCFKHWNESDEPEVLGGFVGEVLAFGCRFGEAIQKALRMANPSCQGVDGNPALFLDPRKQFHTQEEKAKEMRARLEQLLTIPSANRIFAAFQALKTGWSVDDVYGLCKIDRWFLDRLNFLADLFNEAERATLDTIPEHLLRELKSSGCSDIQLANMLRTDAEKVRQTRLKYGIVPHVRQVDTTAGEHHAEKEVLYLTYSAVGHDVDFKKGKSYVVVGSDKYRIGYGSENDWNVVSCLGELRRQKESTVLVTCNPQSAATDLDRSDRLYIEELSFERVFDIVSLEDPQGIFCSVGGMTAHKLGLALAPLGSPVVGTPVEGGLIAQDPARFAALLKSLGLREPQWALATSVEAAAAAAKEIGFPCILECTHHIRGERHREMAYRPQEFQQFLSKVIVSPESPLLVRQMLDGAQDIEVDAVARAGTVVLFGIIEHVERTGVHAGDATLVLPAQKIQVETSRRIEKVVHQLASSLKINDVFKLHVLEKGGDLYVGALNLFAGRTLAFTSKVLEVDFESVATQCALGRVVKRHVLNTYELDYTVVKAPIFSTTWQCGMDPVTGAEMRSTGAVASFGDEIYDAFLTALIATGFNVPQKGSKVLLSTGELEQKMDFLDSAHELADLGYELCGTVGTHQFYVGQGMEIRSVTYPQALEMVKAREISLIINIPTKDQAANVACYQLRRAAVDYQVPLITNMGCAKLLVQSLKRRKESSCMSWKDYLDLSATDLQNKIMKWAETEA
eukprot:GGOE01020138.1.p1 GENE.GGOE01020138.1~~GGOE01020138.1.p1  ORF type:complete len:1475 (-),score=418.89 GGOE01020138.1:480-4736(-)